MAFSISRPISAAYATLMLPKVIAFAMVAPAVADVTPIKTPSGNIECTIGADVGIPADIDCTIFERSGPPTIQRPSSCHDLWGYGFSMREHGVVTVECGPPGSPDTAPGVAVAGYGQIGKFGPIVCRSSVAGFECRNADGHGFFLSRRRQSIF